MRLVLLASTHYLFGRSLEPAYRCPKGTTKNAVDEFDMDTIQHPTHAISPLPPSIGSAGSTPGGGVSLSPEFNATATGWWFVKWHNSVSDAPESGAVFLRFLSANKHFTTDCIRTSSVIEPSGKTNGEYCFVGPYFHSQADLDSFEWAWRVTFPQLANSEAKEV